MHDEERWHRLLCSHLYAAEALELYWGVHGLLRVVEDAGRVEFEHLRDVDVVIWLAKGILHNG